MFEQVVRGARITLFSAMLLVPAVSVSGQGVSAGGTGLGPASQAAGAPVVRKLSVDDAVQLALEQNLDLQVQRVNPQLQDLNIAIARTAWAPTVRSTLGNGSQTVVNYNKYSASSNTVTGDGVQWDFGGQQQLPWGGNYDVSWSNSRTKSNNALLDTNPSLDSSIGVTYTQPLLRNFRIDSYRQQLLVSTKNREISDVQLRQTVLTTVRNVKNAYWMLSYYNAYLEVQQQSLDLARQSLKDNEARVRIGTMAQIDIIQAQAEVASREESVIRAQAMVGQAEDQFRALVMDPKTPDFWNTKFDLTQPPTFQAQPVDLDAAVRRALSARTDLVQERKNLEVNDISLRYLRNQSLPDVNFQANYQLAGSGGTRFNYDSETGAFLGTTQVGYASVMRSLFARDIPTWSFGVQISYPLGTSNAKANLARTQLQRGQAETQLRADELSVVTEVRNAARNVLSNQKRVESTRASRELQEKKLEAEQKKFAAGMSTSFYVFQAQRDLAQAKNAELSAVLDYTRSLVDFETVQQAPTYGNGGTVAVASSGSGGQ